MAEPKPSTTPEAKTPKAQPKQKAEPRKPDQAHVISPGSQPPGMPYPEPGLINTKH